MELRKNVRNEKIREEDKEWRKEYKELLGDIF